MPDDDRRPHSPQSVLRVIQILEALSVSPDPVSLADLSRILKTPKSSMAALLRGLAEADFVVPTEGAYRLGPGAFGLGSALVEARRRHQASDLIRDGMRRLAEQTGETVLLAVRDAGAWTMTYVEVIESRNPMRFAVSVGDRRPLYCTAGGRALLAAGPEEELRRYLDQLKPQALTGRTEMKKARLAEAIAQARAAEVAQTIDEATDGVTGTATALRNAAGSVIGALVVGAPTARLQDRHAELASLVRDMAGTISKSLGYRPERSH